MRSTVLFIGMVFKSEDESFVIGNERGQPQIAANKLGWAFIHGLRTALNRRVDVVSVLMVSRFPIFKKLFIRRKGFADEFGSFRYATYWNFPFIKRFFILCSISSAVMGWLRTHSGRKTMFVYSVYLPTMLPALVLGRFWGAKVILIVPDLPEHMQPGVRFRFYIQFLRNLNSMLCYLTTRLATGFVFLTAAMSQRVEVFGRPWLVVEGCTENQIDLQAEAGSSSPGGGKTIFYSGSLNRAYGIGLLLDAFGQIPDDKLQLRICGRGDFQREVETRARKDSRIEYLGVLPNAKVVSLQRSATLLINPRPSADEFTLYSFPSKILEYMSSARPVICCRLPGIPEEYWKHLISIDDETVAGFVQAITSALSKSDAELDEIGGNGYKFVTENKSPEVQMARVASKFDLVP